MLLINLHLPSTHYHVDFKIAQLILKLPSHFYSLIMFTTAYQLLCLKNQFFFYEPRTCTSIESHSNSAAQSLTPLAVNSPLYFCTHAPTSPHKFLFLHSLFLNLNLYCHSPASLPIFQRLSTPYKILYYYFSFNLPPMKAWANIKTRK
jgi:hypothetical protein